MSETSLPTSLELWDTHRLESFSDSVIAVIITFVAFELRLPHGATWPALEARIPQFLIYMLTFATIGIHWNSHHQLLHAADRISRWVMWANLNHLFWLSLFPVVTAWIGLNISSPQPAVVFGAVLSMAGFAMWLLSRAVVNANATESLVVRAVGNDKKGLLSMILGLVGIGVSFLFPLGGYLVYMATGVLWVIPDRRYDLILEKESRGISS